MPALEAVFFGLAPASVAAFFLACLFAELTPGPNMTYLALVSAERGRRYGFTTAAGVALGLGIIGVAAAFGVTVIIQTSELLYEILRWAGFVYLLWLAWEGWRRTMPRQGEREELGEFAYFRRGLVTNLLNPKAAIFYVSVLPAFLPAEARLQQTLFLTFLFVATATAIHLGIVLLAGSARPLLDDPDRQLIIRRLFSAALAAVAIWFAWSTAR